MDEQEPITWCDAPRVLQAWRGPAWRTFVAKNSCWALVLIWCWAAAGEDCFGQFRVPIPRIPAVPHVPVHLPFFHPRANGEPDHRNGPPPSALESWISEWGMVAVVLAGLGGLAVSPFFRSRKKPCVGTRIRIIAVPPGEAPEGVRRAWVGLVLSLPAGATGSPRTLPAEGVLSGEAARSCLGFLVEGREAITALSWHDPDAAAWWRENVPEVSAEWYRLGFPASVCKVEGTDRSFRALETD